MRKLITFVLVFTLVGGLFTGCSQATQPTEEKINVEELNYDVVVVGGGAAGLSAAIEAAEAGASVVLLEKLPMLGGSTVLSGGIVYSTGSKIQEENGIEDSVDELVNYWLERSENKASESYLRFVAEQSGANVDWLVDLGVKFSEPHATGTSSVLRAVSALEHGSGIINPLKDYAISKNVEVKLQTSAKKLITNESNEVVGVEAEDKDGNVLKISSKAVIIATGGFDRSSELVKEYATVAVDQKTFSGVGNSGDGLSMAKEIGAKVVSNDGVIGFRAVEGEPAYTTEICMLMWMPYLYVNADGERFVDESSDYPVFYESLRIQPQGVSYLIFDQNTYSPVLDKAVEKGSAFVSDSLEGLAEQAGINSENFVNTVNNYNQMIVEGVDSEYGKMLTGHPQINSPKYYALKIVPAILGTLSGLKTDLDARVLNEDGNPITGLYAAGEVANGDFFYKVYPASGTSIQMCIAFGREAGRNAAELINK